MAGIQKMQVAPRVGAWIETHCFRLCHLCLQSHPVWVRGLKPHLRIVVTGKLVSHPVWVRGLKLSDKVLAITPRSVAPRVGAWIETSSVGPSIHDNSVAPRVGAWIETKIYKLMKATFERRTPCGCVD